MNDQISINIKKSTLFKLFLVLVVFVGMADACSTTAEQNTTAQVNNQQAIYNTNQPLHIYQWSVEREMAQQINDFRIEKAIDTWSVWVADGTGEPIDMCASKGFPLPYTSQTTNPLQPSGYTGVAIAQADPNGLFTGTTTATWVACVEDDGTVHPVYIEPHVITYTHPVKIVTGSDGRSHIVRIGKADASTTMNTEPKPAQPTPSTGR